MHWLLKQVLHFQQYFAGSEKRGLHKHEGDRIWDIQAVNVVNKLQRFKDNVKGHRWERSEEILPNCE